MPATPPLRLVPAPALSLQTRIVSQTVILTAFVVVVLTTLSFWIARTLLEQSVRSQLLTLSVVSEDALSSTVRSYRERASFTAMREDVRTWVSRGETTGAITPLFHALREEEPALLGMAFFNGRGERTGTGGETDGLRWDGIPRSSLIPRLTDRGWESVDILVPVRQGERVAGAVAMRFDARDALRPIVTVVPSLGPTARLAFLPPEESGVSVILSSLQPEESFTLTLGEAEDLRQRRTLMMDGGVGRRENERGRDTLAAYRPLPVLGWGMLVEVERRDALSAVRRLALAHAAAGTMLLVFAGTLALLLARQVTQPLRSLTASVRRLGPGQWTVQRTVTTEDEVGVLERVFVDLSVRLRRLYDHLEEEIALRTDALKKQYVLDRAILTTIAYGIITVDRTGKVTGCNPAAVSMLGITEEEMRGRAASDVLFLCWNDGEAHGEHPLGVTLKRRALVRSPAGAFENVRRADGSLLPVTYIASPLLAGKHLFGGIIVFQDVTEERRLEERKSEFVTLASHQLRTPLASLQWYVELLADEKKSLTSAQRGYLVEMRRASDRMLSLLTTLLHAAQYEGKGVQPAIRDVDLSALASDAHGECKAFAQESGVSCTFTGPKQPLMVRSDPVLLKIILQNLLSNAVKYSSYRRKGRVALTVGARRGGVVIRVEDTGIGIPKAEQKRIFERFFRADNVRKFDTDGNGLGLSICKSIVERLGGTITFTSKENAGTTFTVVLPGAVKSSADKKSTRQRKRDGGLRTKD